MAANLAVMVNIGGRVDASVNAAATAVQKRFGALGSSLRLASAEMRAATTNFGKASAGMGGLLAAGGIALAVKGSIGSGADYQHELQALRNAGRTTGQVAQAISEANKTIRQLPTSTLAGNLKMINETTAAFGDYGHALANIGRNQKLAFLLDNSESGHGGDQARSIGDLIRTLEMRGAANDPGRYSTESEMAYKAMMFTRGRVGGSEFRAFAATGNPLVKTLSNDYLYKVAPALMQEFGADQAGTMHQALANTVLGKVGMGGKRYAEEWMRLGLLDKSQARYANNGSVQGWNAGAIKGTDTFLKNPLEWAEKFLLPAFKQRGVNVDDQVAVQVELSKLIGKNTAARLLGSLVNTNDRKRLHKDAAFTDQVQGVDRTYLNTLLNDPKAGMAALKASATNLGAALSSPLLLPMARALVNIADGLNMVASVFVKHPGLAKAAAGLGGALVGMVALASVGKLLEFTAAGLGVFTTAFRVAGSVVPALINNMVPLRLAMIAARYGMLAALGPALPFVAALAAIGVGIAVIAAKWNGIKGFFGGFADGFNRALSPQMRASLSKFGTAMYGVFGAIAKVLGPVVNLVQSAVQWIGKLFAPADVAKWHSAGEAFGGVIGNMANGLAGFIDKIASAIDHMGTLFGMRGGKPVAPAGHRALGGGVSGGKPYLVGEQGAEIVWPGRSGHVSTAAATAAILAGLAGGSPAVAAPAVNWSVNFNVSGVQDPREVCRIVEGRLRDLARESRGYLHD